MTLDDRESARRCLRKKGYGRLPQFRLTPHRSGSSEMNVVTGVRIKTIQTSSDASDTAAREMEFNQSAATAFHLLSLGRRVLALLDPSTDPDTEVILSSAGTGEAELSTLTADPAGPGFLPDLYRHLADTAQRNPISQVNLAIYESFTTHLPSSRKSSPFFPVWEVDGACWPLVERRDRFVRRFCDTALDLLINRGGTRLVFLAISALAARRSCGNLATDGLHKVVGSQLLETFFYDVSYVLDTEELFGVELLPGIVRGGYADRSVRVATSKGVHKGCPAFGSGFGVDEIFPEIDPLVVGEVAALYLTAPDQGSPDHRAHDGLLMLTTAGRSFPELRCLMEAAIDISGPGRIRLATQLPAYVLTPGMVFGGFPNIEAGRLVRVALTPRGQIF